MLDLTPGSVHHTVLLYIVSEPGEWFAGDIVEDLPDLSIRDVEQAIEDLYEAGHIHVHSRDGSLWPRKGARDAVSDPARAAS